MTNYGVIYLGTEGLVLVYPDKNLWVVETETSSQRINFRMAAMLTMGLDWEIIGYL